MDSLMDTLCCLWSRTIAVVHCWEHIAAFGSRGLQEEQSDPIGLNLGTRSHLLKAVLHWNDLISIWSFAHKGQRSKRVSITMWYHYLIAVAFRFKAYKKYAYQYTTESRNGVVGTANLRNGPKVSCQVHDCLCPTLSFRLITECSYLSSLPVSPLTVCPLSHIFR